MQRIKSLLKQSRALILTLMTLLTLSPPAFAASHVIFEDSGQRAAAASPGASWQEYFMRESEGRIARNGDTPWCIQGGSLYYQASGHNSYIEDFIQTSKTFPVNNTVIEFDFRGSAGTSRGYVGPAVLWAIDAPARTGAFQANDGRAAIGIEAWYRWENGGTRGLLLHNNGSFRDYSEAVFSGLNQQNFRHHKITVKDNCITYESDDFSPVTVPLAAPLATGEERRLSLGVRLYDEGVPQILEFRNITITSSEDSVSSRPPDTPVPDDNVLDPHHSNLQDSSDYYRTTYAFLQSIMDGDYDTALALTSPGFQSQTGKTGLASLRDFLALEGEGAVTGKSASINGSTINIAVFIEYTNGSRASVHISCNQGLIERVMGRWGR